MGRPLNNGWHDPRSYAHKDTTKGSGLVVVSGHYWLDDTEFRFSITEQKNARYAGRGRVSLISPVDGKILQVAGPEKRRRMKNMKEEERDSINKGARSERLSATRSVCVSSMSMDSIEAVIETATRKLMNQNIISLEALVASSGPGQQVSVMRAVHLYKDSFASQSFSGKSAKTKNKHKNTLEKAGEVLARLPIDNIRQPDVRRLEKEFGTHPVPPLRLLSRFWEYCRAKRICTGENPFERYLKEQDAPKKSAQNMQRKAVALKALPEKAADKVDALMVENHADGRYMGVLLAKEAGVASGTAAKLCWGDVVFSAEFPDFVQIRLHRDEIVGATHDFTRPLFPFGGVILAERYALLRERYTEDELKTMPVVSTASNPEKAMRAKDITAYCKEVLFKAGMKSSSMLPDKNAEYGAGIKLLLSEYHARLREVCPPSSDAAAYRFLCGLSLENDVTADHYRSFTNLDGQWYLYRLLCRDGRKVPFQSEAGGNVSTEATPNGIRHIYNTEHPDMLMAMSFTITLNAGESFSIASLGGVEGTFEVIPSGCDQDE